MSKLALGTVQFGMAYGISNTKGQVDAQEVEKILTMASAAGINLWDTASGYGESEKVLGGFSKSHAVQIVSKFVLGESKPDNLKLMLQESLRQLHRSSLEGYLVHKFADYQKHNNLLWGAMKDLKAQGLVKKIGFSLYQPHELEEILNDGLKLEMVQVPYNVFDRRFEPYFSELKQRGVEIHVRSVFLQGLAFLEEPQLKGKLIQAANALRQLRKIAQLRNRSVGAICLGFCLSNTSIDKVIVGVTSAQELQEHIQTEKQILQEGFLAQDLEAVQIDDEDILLPFRWPKEEVNHVKKH